MNTKLPKMLPWLAKSAGLPEARVQELWADAIRHATLKTGWVNTPEYWTAANDKLLELIEAEALAYRKPQFAPWVAFNMRVGALPLMAANQIALAWTNALRRFNPPRRPSHRHAA